MEFGLVLDAVEVEWFPGRKNHHLLGEVAI
jgi:hypothetical protein